MQTLIFQPDEYLHPKLYLFKQTELGKIYQTIPWQALENCLPKVDYDKPGPKPWFSNTGMFGLMFLKHLLDISDEKLMERFNTDWSLQLFCGKLLGDDEKIRDLSMVSRVRGYIGNNSDWHRVQEVLLDHWKEDMDAIHALFMDATCYESYIRFPTDVKLLWESCVWVFEKLLFKFCRILGIKKPRSKYNDQKKKQNAYAKLRKKPYKKNRKRHGSLVYLLSKGLGQLQGVLNAHPELKLTESHRFYIRTIKAVLAQQKCSR